MTFDTLASQETITKVTTNLMGKGYIVTTVPSSQEALETIKALIPAGASVMNGSSKTLEQIGYIDYLKTEAHSWDNLHAKIVAEQDPQKQELLRRQSVLSDYYIGSVHALVENGEFVVASNTGSQLPHIVYTSPNLIFVVSTKKIVPTLDEALKRLEEYVIPLEDENMKTKYGMGTQLSKLAIIKAESPFSTRNVHFLLVQENLGF